VNLALCLAALAFAGPRPVKLVVANPAHRAYFGQIVEALEAKGSRQTKAVLHGIKKPVPIIFQKPSPKEPTGAALDLDLGFVDVSDRRLKYFPAKNGPVLIHEITHILQEEAGVLPMDSEDTEFEAYTNDFRASRELGVRPSRDSYDGRVLRAFRQGVRPFLEFLRKEYADEPMARYKDLPAYLDNREAAAVASLKELRKQRARELVHLRPIRGLQRQAFRNERIAPIEQKILEERLIIHWAKRDRAILQDPVRFKRYQTYRRNIMRRLHAEWKRWAALSRRGRRRK
jgi:hypothetical protein